MEQSHCWSSVPGRKSGSTRFQGPEPSTQCVQRCQAKGGRERRLQPLIPKSRNAKSTEAQGIAYMGLDEIGELTIFVLHFVYHKVVKDFHA